MATTVVELLANKRVAEAARKLQEQVRDTHEIISSKGYKAAQPEIDAAEGKRQEIIGSFQNDLGIKPPGTAAWWRTLLKPRSHEHHTSSEADDSHIK